MTSTATAASSNRRSRTRQRLVSAAADIFAENGFGGSSLDQICERAGLTRGAFHYNFRDREELFIAVMQREFADTLQALAPVRAHPTTRGDHAELLELLLEVYAGRAGDFVVWSRLSEEFRLHAMRDARAAEAYTAHFAVIHERVGAELERGADNRGLVMLAPPVGVARVVTGTFIQAVSDGVLAGLDSPAIQQAAAERTLLVLRALMPDSPA